MITQFKLFEKIEFGGIEYEDVRSLIGLIVVLKDVKNAWYQNKYTRAISHREFMDCHKRVGWSFKIDKVSVLYSKGKEDIILISPRGDECEYNLENFQIKNKGIRISDEDPYGEEDWENESKVNERHNVSNINDLIGRIVILNDPTDALCNNVDDFEDTRNPTGWSFEVRSVMMMSNTILIGPDINAADYNLDNFDIIGEPKKLNRKYTEDDPYGEEDWEK